MDPVFVARWHRLLSFVDGCVTTSSEFRAANATLETAPVVATLARMNITEQEAIVTVCLMAALVDGGQSDAERDQVKRIADNLRA